MARLDIRELEVIASNRIISERKRRSFSDNLPLNLSVFTETLSGMSFFNTHGVLARRMGVIGLELEQQRLEQSLQRIGECANSGAWPSLAEIREILNPPFESFGVVAVGPPESAVQVDTPNIVVHVDFTTGKVINPQNPVPLEHFPISA